MSSILLKTVETFVARFKVCNDPYTLKIIMDEIHKVVEDADCEMSKFILSNFYKVLECIHAITDRINVDANAIAAIMFMHAALKKADDNKRSDIVSALVFSFETDVMLIQKDVVLVPIFRDADFAALYL
jgi:hypothetical protein